jgi:hypothetical protein
MSDDIRILAYEEASGNYYDSISLASFYLSVTITYSTSIYR